MRAFVATRCNAIKAPVGVILEVEFDVSIFVFIV